MKRFRNTLGLLVGALLCLMALATTAAPVQAHTVSHWLNPVAAGEHHHHHEDGSVTADHHSQGEDSSADQGHDHITSAATVVMAPPVQAGIIGALFARGQPVLIVGDAAPPGLHPPPDDRPPRTI